MEMILENGRLTHVACSADVVLEVGVVGLLHPKAAAERPSETITIVQAKHLHIMGIRAWRSGMRLREPTTMQRPGYPGLLCAKLQGTLRPYRVS